MKITCLVDNKSYDNKLKDEHGLSMHIECEDWQILFDTGLSGTALLYNANSINVDLSKINGVFVSHGHYDHTGGLAKLSEKAKNIPIYCHQDIFNLKFVSKNSTVRNISILKTEEELIQLGFSIKFITEPIELFPDLWVLSADKPDAPCFSMKDFYIIKNGDPVNDDFSDEVFLLYKTGAGWILISGCCHKGLFATLETAKRFTKGGKIISLIGGFHLNCYPKEDFIYFNNLCIAAGVKEAYLNHCSGIKSPTFLSSKNSLNACYFSCGQTIEFKK